MPRGGKTIGLYESDSSSSWTFQGWSAQNISHHSELVLAFWITVNTPHLPGLRDTQLRISSSLPPDPGSSEELREETSHETNN